MLINKGLRTIISIICELGIEKNLKADMYFQNSNSYLKSLNLEKCRKTKTVGFSHTLGTFFGAKKRTETDRKIRLTAQL